MMFQLTWNSPINMIVKKSPYKVETVVMETELCGDQVCTKPKEQLCSYCPNKYTVNAGNYCTNICIESDLYCNGNIDMPNDSNSTIFIKNYSTINYTISDVLLYPDELYCSSRLHAVFMIAYVLTFVSFSFSIALVVRTRPLLHFLIRRRTKEIKMKKEMFECS